MCVADLAASKGKEEKGEIHCGLLESLLQLRTAVPAVCNMGERVLLNVHVVSVTGRGGAGFLRMAPPSLRLRVKILPLLPAPSSMGPRTGPRAGRVVFFPRQDARRASVL